MRLMTLLTFGLMLAAAGCSCDDKKSNGPSDSDTLGGVGVQNAFPHLSFDKPLDLQFPNDGSNRLFVVEQDGIILTFENDTASAVADTFLDIRDRVSRGHSEEGLLGLAFHPDYATNGYFYVNYTTEDPLRTHVSRFTVTAGSPNRANVASELVILEFNQPFRNHNGGCLMFGPDGFLYIGTGDGGSGGDPLKNAQNRSVILGKLLRIDVDNPSGGRQYGIPLDNPYTGNSSGYREEIYAYGLRNPWRFSFDSEGGTLWLADVGQNRYEEIDIIEKGGNYGWDIMEARHCFEPSTGCDQSGLTMPIWEYGRSDGISVTGGYVYRGPSVPGLTGWYLFADFGSGKIWALRKATGQPAENRFLMDSGKNISSFGVDQNKELYITSFDGNIYRFIATE